MEWTEELIGRLRTLWDKGLPTAEIGRQLSISKNAVVGKAHRLKLPPRPSPIKNRASSDERKVATPRKRVSAAKKNGDELPLEGGKTGRSSSKKHVTHKENSPVNLGGKLVAEKKSESTGVKFALADKAKKGSAIKEEKKLVASPSPEKKEPQTPHIAVMPRAFMGSSAPARKVAPVKRERDPLERSFRQGLTCQWPHGNPGEADFHFCGGVPLAGKPYCAEHAAIAYVKIRGRGE